jgi:hypothetical protein
VSRDLFWSWRIPGVRSYRIDCEISWRRFFSPSTTTRLVLRSASALSRSHSTAAAIVVPDVVGKFKREAGF